MQMIKTDCVHEKFEMPEKFLHLAGDGVFIGRCFDCGQLFVRNLHNGTGTDITIKEDALDSVEEPRDRMERLWQ
ncbi:MAG: hypothetical protein M1505_00820 [Patescibacteria group bacterium]|nr:hypothetical protein [Patescibacteria group bacterium]MCL5257762.1 hypothetical protein [Patescibacteria group bacterium]